MAPPTSALSANFHMHLAGKSPETRRVYLASVERLTTWAQRNGLSPIALQAEDLQRFFAEEARSYASATVQVRRAAVRAFYEHLRNEGIVESNPASDVRLASVDRLASLRGPVEYLTDTDITRLRQHARRRGAISNLAVCMLHETPASVRQIARLTIADFAQDAKGRPFAILGQTATTKTPWPISQQALNAIETLHTDSLRLISPHTRNPNLRIVKVEIQEARLSAGVQTPEVAAALKRAHRRRVQQLCAHVRLTPSGFARYQRMLLPKLTPLDPGRAEKPAVGAAKASIGCVTSTRPVSHG
jgi:site-specific recombinase XerD